MTRVVMKMVWICHFIAWTFYSGIEITFYCLQKGSNEI